MSSFICFSTRSCPCRFMATKWPSTSVASSDEIIENAEHVGDNQGHQAVEDIIWYVALLYDKGNSGTNFS